MKKTIIIYESKYGATRQYAQWLSEALSCKAVPGKQLHPADLAGYDTIIFGGGLYAGGINGISLLTRSFPSIQNKNIILFTCGLANPENEENLANLKAVIARTLSPEMQKAIRCFFLRGAINYSRLSFTHKIMMAMMHKMLLKKDASARTSEDRSILETYGKEISFLDKNSIRPLVDYALAINSAFTNP